MTLMEFFGCTFISFGPPLALFIFTIARDPMRVIVMIASGFFWQLALLTSSLLWFAVVPLRDKLAFGLVFSVIFQEAFRFLFYKILRKADKGLNVVSQHSEAEHVNAKDFTNKHIMAYVSGLGFGVLAGLFSFVNVLADMAGPGTIGIHGDSKYFFWASSFMALCIILLHTSWGVIFFAAMDKKQYIRVALVMLSHMLISCLTLLNQNSSNTNSTIYLASIIPAYIILFISIGTAFHMAGGKVGNIRAALVCRKGRYEID